MAISSDVGVAPTTSTSLNLWRRITRAGEMTVMPDWTSRAARERPPVAIAAGTHPVASDVMEHTVTRVSAAMSQDYINIAQ